MTADFGRWYHVVGVYRPGEEVSLYIDGVLKVSNTTSIPALQHNSALNVNIGRRSDALVGSYFKGPIDDVRIYNRALSGDEIKRLYNMGHIN